MMTNEPPNEQGRRDKVIADSGWGIKPDDQPANTGEAGGAQKSIQYDPQQPDVVKTILRLQRQGFNTATKVRIEPGRTTIIDLNGDAFVVVGLSFGGDHLMELLKTLGASFDPRALEQLGPDFEGVREYGLTRTWAWGAERTG